MSVEFYVWLNTFLLINFPYLFFYIDNKTSNKESDDVLYIPVISHITSLFLMFKLMCRLIAYVIKILFIKLYETKKDKNLKKHIKEIDPYDEEQWDSEYNWKNKLNRFYLYKMISDI